MAVHSVLGGELAWAADNDPDVSRILAHRFPDVPNLGDITKVDWFSVEAVDILVAGTPCQDVSQAGARAGLRAGTRSGVWLEAVHAIRVLRPRLVLIENVLGLLTARGDDPTAEHLAAEARRDALEQLAEWLVNAEKIAAVKGDARRVRQCGARSARVMGLHKQAVARCRWHESRLVRAIGTVLGSLASLGFDACWTVVSAADAGAPHQRKRVFILAWPAADTEHDGSPGTEIGCGAGVRAAPRRAGWPAPDEHREPAGVHRAAADAGGGEPERRGAARNVGSTLPGACGQDGQRDPGGHPAGDRGAATVADTDRATGDERRLPASGQAEGGRSPADTGGPGGTRTAADAEGDGRDERRPAPARIVGGPDAAVSGDGTPADTRGTSRDECATAERGRGDDAAADADGRGLAELAELDSGTLAGLSTSLRNDALGHVLDWGAYGPAIARWEAILGRRAPRPTEPGRTGERLSPRFVEWMMGLPDGWVTGVPGLSRNAQLKALGNGVVPQQAVLALTLLLDRAGFTEAGEAA